MSAATEQRRWTFGAVEFDERRFELRVNGVPVELEPKPLEVLLHLLRHAGEIVTKDELMAAVWPGRILTDNSLPKSISRIREVIGDDDQSVIKTVHGYGYRLVAPVTVQAARAAPALTRLDLEVGDHPPLRPLWSLVRQLGGGGQGEVWLARHDKTREERVFKFALDLACLAAIKREITLYRFLRETLEGRDQFTRVLDWNLEEAPYYIELEHSAGGNLDEWAESAGGLAAVPLATRLELVAQIAEALAAAHSVGVLHKDLKPSNVLVISSPLQGPLRIKLMDFGSGGVLDPHRLEALGITRLGFTQSIMQGEAAATAMYLAPEVMSGQPATVQADVYSLGILLYQMVTGDLKRPLAPGWERRLNDDLLCEDIALAVAGEPARRLADASSLATRLRTLEERRRQRAAEQAEKLRLEQEQRAAEERARKAELAVERLRTRRAWQRTVLAILIVAVSISLGLFFQARRAQQQAVAAAASSQAVADFLSRDMFAVVGSRPLRDLTVPELLEAASATLSDRFANMPGAAAQIHLALGNAFFSMESFEQAERELDRALAFHERADADVHAMLQVASTLVLVKTMTGKLTDELPRFEDALARSQRALGAQDPGVMRLRQALAHVRLAWFGDWQAAAAAFSDLARDAAGANPPDDKIAGDALALAGQALWYLGRHREAGEALNQAKERFARLDGLSPLMSLARAVEIKAKVHTELGQFEEAEAELAAERALIDGWVPNARSAHLISLDIATGQLRWRQGRLAEAITVLNGAIAALQAAPWSKSLDATLEPRVWLAFACRDAGRLGDAEAALRAALAARSLAPSHPFFQAARMTLADVLRLRGDRTGAQAVLESLDRSALERLGNAHPWVTEVARIEKHLAMASGR